MDGPKKPRLEKSWQSWVRSWGRMGRQHRGGVLIVKSAAQRSDVTWKLLDASGGQAKLLIKKPCPRDIIPHALG